MPDARQNPFIIGHHAEGDHFADRAEEVRRIAAAFADPSSRLLVYGDRRLGKSSTIHAAAAQARAAGHAVAIVDLAAATSAAAASQRLLAAVQREIGQRWRDLLTRAATRLRGMVTFAPRVDLHGNVTFGISVQASGSPAEDLRFFTDVLDAIEAELAERDLSLGLAIDEFQRLRALTGVAIDWPLKEVFERHRRIAYVCAGSERGLIEQMLDSKKVGLWKVGDVLHMEPIPYELLAPWIVERGRATGLTIDLVTAAAVCRLAGPRTRDIVQLARAVWDATHDGGVATRDDVGAAMDVLVTEQSALHQRQWARLDEVKQRILLALATDPAVAITASETLDRHRLGPKSTAHRLLNELIDEEIIVDRAGSGGERGFDDPFFRRWIELNVIEDLGRTPPPLLPGAG